MVSNFPNFHLPVYQKDRYNRTVVLLLQSGVSRTLGKIEVGPLIVEFPAILFQVTHLYVARIKQCQRLGL